MCMNRNRNLMLILPLALLAACSNPSATAPAGTGGDDLAPAPTAAADQKAVAALDAQRLQGNHWRLDSATDASGKRVDALFAREDKPVTLDFQDGRIAVSNTCNRMGGSYTLADGTLTVSPMASTMMACTDKALMALDQAIGSRLEGALKTELAGEGQLTLRTASGDVLVFTPEPTAETRYGGPGETVFLEVAAQTKPCSHPLIPNMQCLQTREVAFDDKGLKQGTPGEFENFYGTIEGYTHEDGVRNVVRVKRYKIANPPADGSSVAYVLDMVVESANEKK
ncbi:MULTISPECIES: META domain-containing protein [Stenotrophomonas]|jgi:heat shock protein HslJ